MHRKHSRKLAMPLSPNPDPIPLWDAPAPWDNKNIAPFSSPYHHFDFHKDSLLVIASSSNNSNWQRYIEIFTNIKIKTGLLIMIGHLENDQVEEVNRILDELSKNTLFYWTYTTQYQDTTVQIWKQIITLFLQATRFH